MASSISFALNSSTGIVFLFCGLGISLSLSLQAESWFIFWKNPLALHVANKNITCTLLPNFRFLFFILLNDEKGKILFAPNVTFTKTDSRYVLWRTVVLVSFPFLYLSSQASGFGPLPPLLCTAPKLVASSLAEADLGQLCPQQTQGESALWDPLQRSFGRVHDKHDFHLKPVNSIGNCFLPWHRKDQFVTVRWEKTVSRIIYGLHLFIYLSFVHPHAYQLFWSYPHWLIRKYTVLPCSHLWRVHFFCPAQNNILLGIARSLGCRFKSSPVHCPPVKHSVTPGDGVPPLLISSIKHGNGWSGMRLIWMASSV